MTFKEMFLAEHPIDGEQMLEEARIKAAKQANEIRFIKGRLKFGSAITGAPFPSALAVYHA